MESQAEDQGANVPQVPRGIGTPKVNFATQFNLGMSPVEVLISFGHTRPVPDQSGNLGGSAVVEWTGVYTMSPTAAKQLSLQLVAVLQDYESNFGKIPLDPDFKKRFPEV
jgi:hypothetical protein